MRIWKLLLTCICAVIIGVPISAFSSNTISYSLDSKPNQNQNIISQTGEFNALVLSCETSESTVKRSFASVLQMQTNSDTKHQYDVAITTGHGLLSGDGKLLENCFVSYPGGEKILVSSAKLAPNFKSGTPTDWAVITFPKIKQASVIRYSVDHNISQKSLEEYAEIRPSVLFSTARGLPINGQHCEIEPRRFAGLKHQNFLGFLSHNCRAIAGQSGTPISVMRNQDAILIGIHVGNSMVYGYPTINTPLHYRGYMRAIDTAFLKDFAEILSNLDTRFQNTHKPK